MERGLSLALLYIWVAPWSVSMQDTIATLAAGTLIKASLGGDPAPEKLATGLALLDKICKVDSMAQVCTRPAGQSCTVLCLLCCAAQCGVGSGPVVLVPGSWVAGSPQCGLSAHVMLLGLTMAL